MIKILQLALILTLTVLVDCQAENERFSPLQVPEKVSIKLVQFVNSSSPFTLSITFIIGTNMSADAAFCFRKKFLRTYTELSACNITDQISNLTDATTLDYNCYRMFKNTSDKWQSKQYNGSLKYYNSNYNLKSVVFENFTEVGEVALNQSASSKSLNISIFEIDQIYQMKTCTYFNESWKSCGQLRSNYIHTFLHKNLVDNLIMQRHVSCFVQNTTNITKNTIIFTGGTIRNLQWCYFFAVLVIKNGQNLNMWGGLSYSQSHTLTDMFGFQTRTGRAYDLFSLYASAPFVDSATNVNGTNNIVVISNSFDETNLQIKSYFVQYYRLYTTGDLISDDPLVQKIDNKYCFVAYFDDSNYETVLSPLAKNFKHQTKQCWSINLSLFSQKLVIWIWPTLILIYLMVTI